MGHSWSSGAPGVPPGAETLSPLPSSSSAASPATRQLLAFSSSKVAIHPLSALPISCCQLWGTKVPWLSCCHFSSPTEQPLSTPPPKGSWQVRQAKQGRGNEKGLPRSLWVPRSPLASRFPWALPSAPSVHRFINSSRHLLIWGQRKNILKPASRHSGSDQSEPRPQPVSHRAASLSPPHPLRDRSLLGTPCPIVGRRRGWQRAGDGPSSLPLRARTAPQKPPGCWGRIRSSCLKSGSLFPSCPQPSSGQAGEKPERPGPSPSYRPPTLCASFSVLLLNRFSERKTYGALGGGGERGSRIEPAGSLGGQLCNWEGSSGGIRIGEPPVL